MPRVEQAHGGGYIIFGRGHGREGTYVQTDYDFPATATDLGWSLRRVQADRKGNVKHFSRVPKNACDHRGTDGTVTCPDCGIVAGDFIGAAAEFLDSKS